MKTITGTRLLSVLLPLAVLLIIGLGFVLAYANNHATSEVVLGLVIIFGACTLLYMLYLIAFGFSALNLDDKTQALGLPDGSIRALIALLLIVIWVIIGVFLFSYVGGLFPSVSVSADGIKFAQTFYATMSTLVVALAAFYFGTASVKVAQGGPAIGPAPEIATINSPEPAPWAGKNVAFTITGKNFLNQPIQPIVKFIKDTTEVVATGITSSDTRINGNVLISATAGGETWDVIVINSDGTDSGQSGKGLFTIKQTTQ
ncbi:MAG TPA: hypothetical protein VKP04_08250 [Ktedonobacteraceae bacterium]|nr:hypothetical protein [Ktedonobacteraceae bacterium]